MTISLVSSLCLWKSQNCFNLNSPTKSSSDSFRILSSMATASMSYSVFIFRSKATMSLSMKPCGLKLNKFFDFTLSSIYWLAGFHSCDLIQRRARDWGLKWGFCVQSVFVHCDCNICSPSTQKARSALSTAGMPSIVHSMYIQDSCTEITKFSFLIKIFSHSWESVEMRPLWYMVLSQTLSSSSLSTFMLLSHRPSSLLLLADEDFSKRAVGFKYDLQ